jgi:hypothetical protein
MMLQCFKKHPERKRFHYALVDDHWEAVFETGSSVQMLRELRRRGYSIPSKMQGPECEYTVDLKESA